MKNPIKRNTIAAVLAALILMIAGMSFMIRMDTDYAVLSAESQGAVKVKEITESLKNAGAEQENVGVWTADYTNYSIDIMTDALKEYVTENGYEGPKVFQNGIVAEIRDGELILPEEAKEIFEEEPLTIEHIQAASDPNMFNRPGIFLRMEGSYSAYSILSVGEISDNVYFVGWTKYSDLPEYSVSFANLADTVEALENTYNGHCLIADRESLNLVFGLEEYAEIQNVQDLGLTRNMIRNQEGQLSFDGKNYNLFYSEAEIEGRNCYVIFMEPVIITNVLKSILRSLLIGLIILVVLATLILWLSETQRFVRDKVLEEPQRVQYHPKRIRSLAVTAVLIGGLLIAVIAGFVEMTAIMRARTENQREALDMVLAKIGDDSGSPREKAETQFYISCGKNLAALLKEYPELITREKLNQFARDINADYIMLFDGNGNETSCSQDYKGFTLTADPEAKELGALLLGRESVVIDPYENPSTGKKLGLIGITMSSDSFTEQNGVLVIALRPTEDWFYVTDDISEQLILLVPENSRCFALDTETATVRYSSSPEMLGLTIREIGMNENNLRDDFIDFFRIGKNRYFGVSNRQGSDIYYYVTRTDEMFRSVLPHILRVVLMYLFISTVICVILLKDYTEEVFNEWATTGVPVVVGALIEVKASDGRIRRTVDPSRRWTFLFTRWNDLYPEERTWIVFELLLMIIICLMIPVVSRINTSLDQVDLLSFIMTGEWSRGVNLFAAFASLIVVANTFLIVSVTRLFLQTVARFMTTRGETICRLCYSFVQYLGLFAGLYFVFAYFGFDTRAVLGGLGLISLALSLGSKDMVSDIIAGLSIVFEGDFQVGDIVEIGGFRGTVQEIGVRSTKLIGLGDNIKIINNHDIHNVVNMTRLNSWYALELPIPVTTPVQQMEQALKKALPEIGKRNPNILSGPYYKGINAISSSSMTIAVIAECREENYRKVQRYLNREILLLFEREGIVFK